MREIYNSLFHPYTPAEFEKTALSIFHFQYQNNTVYREYCQHVHVSADAVCKLYQIPFLPISFFKTHTVKTTDFEPEIIFQSSGTTGATLSHHCIKDKKLYETSLLRSFDYFYGNPENYAFVALLPDFQERPYSSLLYMVKVLMAQSGHAGNGFFLRNHSELYQTLMCLRAEHQKTVLWGTPFTLLQFIDEYQLDFPQLTVFETGGMKGQRREMVKAELYELLGQAFGTAQIHSEYGMCELLSQAYCQKGKCFFTPPWMRLQLRDERDPLAAISPVDTGIINIIDFANLYSCSFISTEDLGRRHVDNGIEIIGRTQEAQLRGCNLLYIPKP